MIFQTSTGDFPAGAPCYDGGNAYAVRVVQFSAGATIAFDNPKSTRKILGYFAYRNSRPGGWKSIYLTGTAIIEVATQPEESFGGSGVAGVATIDTNQNTVIVGPPGSQSTDPVQVTPKVKASYKVAKAITLTGSNLLLSIEAGASKTVKLRRLRLTAAEVGSTAAAFLELVLKRFTGPATTGTVLTPAQDDSTDSAYSGVVRLQPGGGVTPSGDNLVDCMVDSPAVANKTFVPVVYDYLFDGVLAKPPTIQPGVSQGMALTTTLQAGQVGSLSIEAWFTEE